MSGTESVGDSGVLHNLPGSLGTRPYQRRITKALQTCKVKSRRKKLVDSFVVLARTMKVCKFPATVFRRATRITQPSFSGWSNL
jgi:hypothetical protein